MTSTYVPLLVWEARLWWRLKGRSQLGGHWWLKQTRMDGSQVPFLLQGQRGCPEVSVSGRKAPRPWGNTSLRYVEHYLLGCELWGFSAAFCVILLASSWNVKNLTKEPGSYWSKTYLISDKDFREIDVKSIERQTANLDSQDSSL